jgi:DNA-binding transcriptional LysR family regulator
MRLIVDDIFQQHSMKSNIVLESEVWAIIIDVVQKGIAYTIFPPREFQAEIAAGHLRSVPVAKPAIQSGLCLARLSGVAMPPHADVVFNFMAKKLKKLIRSASSRTRTRLT